MLKINMIPFEINGRERVNSEYKLSNSEYDLRIYFKFDTLFTLSINIYSYST